MKARWDFKHRAFILSGSGRILVGVDQASVAQLRHHSDPTAFGEGKATLATSDHTGVARHFRVHIPGRMNDDGPIPDIAVAAVESIKPHRWTMRAMIGIGGDIGPGRRGIGAWRIRKPLDPPRMGWVGSPAVRNQMGCNVTGCCIDDEKTRRAGGPGKIDDPDPVRITQSTPVLPQRRPGAAEQGRRELGRRWRGPDAARRSDHQPGSSKSYDVAAGYQVHEDMQVVYRSTTNNWFAPGRVGAGPGRMAPRGFVSSDTSMQPDHQKGY